MISETPADVAQCGRLIAESRRVIVAGSHSKPGMFAAVDDAVQVSTRALTGVVEYEPTEFTITVRAGTALSEVTRVLDEQQQYLPFDPPRMGEQSTIGGVVASGLCGSARVRHGGIRDFIIGVQLVDGRGVAVRGGGKVVKNAAGFDLPKLIVGSCGWLGVLTEVTFKVFPRPPCGMTIIAQCETINLAAEALGKLMQAPFDIDAIELEADASIVVRLAGEEQSLRAHADRIGGLLDLSMRSMSEEEAIGYWQPRESLSDVAGEAGLVRMPITAAIVDNVFENVNACGGAVRVSAAGSLAWVGLPDESACRCFEELAAARQLPWQRVRRGSIGAGRMTAGAKPFADKVKQAFDPDRRFVSVWDEAEWPVGAHSGSAQ